MLTTTKRVKMPTATVDLICGICQQSIADIDLNTKHLSTVLFQLRKDHAKEVHGWQDVAKV